MIYLYIEVLIIFNIENEFEYLATLAERELS